MTSAEPARRRDPIDKPAGWARVRLGLLSFMRSGEGITSEGIREEGPFPVYGGNGVRGYSDRHTHDGEYVLVGRQGALCGNVRRVSGTFWASEHAVVAGLRAGNSVGWFAYLLESLNLNQYSVSAAQPGLAIDRIKSLIAPVPPLDVQRYIADFLDRKTAAIDALIAKKERLIELLEEKRQALITQAVTKGLDPNVPMKDSGVEWVPVVPHTWRIVPLRHLLSFGPKNGISPPPAAFGGALSFSISAVRDGRVRVDGHEKYVDLDPRVAKTFSMRPGDILLMRGNGNLELVGSCGLVDEVPAGCTYPDILMRMRPAAAVRGEFLVAALNSPYSRGQVEVLARTSNGTYKVSGEDVRSLMIAVPPLAEQDRLIDRLTRETRRLRVAAEAAGSSVNCLREYRQALISAAVTGKLDVRANAPDPEAAAEREAQAQPP